MGKTVPNAFTLVELLVVIAIMGLIGAYVLSNYGSFGEDQKLKNAVLDIQSLLRTAQTNATTNTKCDSQSGASWRVLWSVDRIDLGCQAPGMAGYSIKKSKRLDSNINLNPTTGTPSSCLPAFIVVFAPISGKVTLGIPLKPCTSLTITLGNSKLPAGSNTKSLKIEQGGRIYAN